MKSSYSQRKRTKKTPFGSRSDGGEDQWPMEKEKEKRDEVIGWEFRDEPLRLREREREVCCPLSFFYAALKAFFYLFFIYLFSFPLGLNGVRLTALDERLTASTVLIVDERGFRSGAVVLVLGCEFYKFLKN